MIRIKSKRAGFRRCGIAHPIETVEYPDDRFTPEEIGIMQADPMLTVEIVSVQGQEGSGRQSGTGDEVKEIGKEPVSAGKKGKR